MHYHRPVVLNEGTFVFAQHGEGKRELALFDIRSKGPATMLLDEQEMGKGNTQSLCRLNNNSIALIKQNLNKYWLFSVDIRNYRLPVWE